MRRTIAVVFIDHQPQKTDQVSVPVAITVFLEEVYRAPETWARRAFRNLIHFQEADRDGHFAGDIRSFSQQSCMLHSNRYGSGTSAVDEWRLTWASRSPGILTPRSSACSRRLRGEVREFGLGFNKCGFRFR